MFTAFKAILKCFYIEIEYLQYLKEKNHFKNVTI